MHNQMELGIVTFSCHPVLKIMSAFSKLLFILRPQHKNLSAYSNVSKNSAMEHSNAIIIFSRLIIDKFRF